MNILFIAPSRLGDCVMAYAALSHAINKHPDSHFFIASASEFFPLFEGINSKKTLIPLENKKYHMHWFYLWSKLFTRKWDAIIETRGSVISWFLRSSSCYKVRPKSYIPGSANEQIQRIFRANLFPHVWPGLQHKERADKIMNYGGEFIIAISPFASWPEKEWAVENFKSLYALLRTKIKNVKFIVFSDAPERVKALSCFDIISSENIGVVAHCLSKCHMFIGSDSGLFHVAHSLDVPSVCLLGPTPKYFLTWDENTICVDGRGLMKSISPEMVCESVYKLYKNIISE